MQLLADFCGLGIFEQSLCSVPVIWHGCFVMSIYHDDKQVTKWDRTDAEVVVGSILFPGDAL